MRHPSAIEAIVQTVGIVPRSAPDANPSSFLEPFLTGRYKLPGRDP